MLCLRMANWEDVEKEYLFVKDIPADENGYINEWHGVSRADFDRALDSMIACSQGRDLPEGYVPETFYFLWNDDEIVGQFRLRHWLCDSLKTGAGHIGYFVGKEFRKRGYAREGLRLILQLARDIIPEDEIYLRVNRNNAASLKVMLANGGYIKDDDEQKFYVRIPK